VPIKHQHQTARADSTDVNAVQPSYWNADHAIDGLLGLIDSLAPQPKTVFALDAQGKPALKALSEFMAAQLGAANAATLLQALGAAALAGPEFSGAPTAPTAALGTNTDQIATMRALLQLRNDMTLPSKATLALTFDTYRTTYDIAALGSMTTHGLTGTLFVIPEKIDGAAGAQTLTSDELAIMQAKGWELGAYASNVGQSQNMQQVYTADRKQCGLRFKELDTLMRAKGFPVVSIAPMQRAWYHPQITEMVRPWFKAVRVVDQLDLASYPISDPCFVSHGGGSASWSNADTLSSLSATLDSVIASKGLWVPVIHQIGAVPDAYTVAQTVFDNFMAYVKTKVDAGVLRVTTFSKAMGR